MYHIEDTDSLFNSQIQLFYYQPFIFSGYEKITFSSFYINSAPYEYVCSNNIY